MLSQILLSASAAIVLFAGTLHLHGTFYGTDLRPQDPELEARMKEALPNITGLTTMWNLWLGFNAILSLGLMFFGLMYGYLTIFRFAVLQESPFLLAIGLVFLAGSIVFWKRYTFYLPVRVFLLSLAFYAAGIALA